MTKETREKCKLMEGRVAQGQGQWAAAKELGLSYNAWMRYRDRRRVMKVPALDPTPEKTAVEGKAVVIVCDVSKLRDVLNKL